MAAVTLPGFPPPVPISEDEVTPTRPSLQVVMTMYDGTRYTATIPFPHNEPPADFKRRAELVLEAIVRQYREVTR